MKIQQNKVFWVVAQLFITLPQSLLCYENETKIVKITHIVKTALNRLQSNTTNWPIKRGACNEHDKK